MFEINKGDLLPLLTDTLTMEGEPVDITNATVVFRMRLETDSTLVVDSAAEVVDGPTGEWRYVWAAGDTDVAGDYMGWLRVTLPATEPMDTPEFAIRILDAHDLPAGSLCSLADVREGLEYEAAYTERDSLILTKIADASALIMRYCWREFAPATDSITRRLRFYPYRRRAWKSAGYYEFDLGFGAGQPYDLRAASAVTLHPDDTEEVALTADTEYDYGDLRDGVYTALRFTSAVPFGSLRLSRWGYVNLDITGNWGFLEVPTSVRDACVDAVLSWLRRDIPAFANADVTTDVIAPRGVTTLWLPSSTRKKIAQYTRFPLVA